MPRRRPRLPATPEQPPVWRPGDILPGGPPVPPPTSLFEWIERLPGLPRPVHRVVMVGCRHHEEGPMPLSRVEADAVAGVALRRCEDCDDAVPLLDSEERWTAPPLWACAGCGTAQLELAAGLSVPDGEHVEWVLLAGRCAACHAMTGLTDIVVSGQPVNDVLAGL